MLKFLKNRALKPRPKHILPRLLELASQSKDIHVLQLGANDGVYADPLHAVLLSNPAIHATRVEPVPYYFELLSANMSKFGLSPRVRCLQYAVAMDDGFVDIVFPDPSYAFGGELQGHGRLLGTLINVDNTEGWLSLRVPSLSPWSLLQQAISPEADALLTDLEGFDSELLASMSLRDMKSRIVYIEAHSRLLEHDNMATHFSDAIRALAMSGFNQIVWDGQDLIAWKSPPAHKTSKLALVD
jgi:hypothetical protein